MRGHTLIWYSQTPDWIFHEDFDQNKDLVDRDVMLNRMEIYIKNVFQTIDELGYTDLFYAYDIVNEALMENGTKRSNRWTQIIGEDYLWYAFYYADKYAPESIDLYYNDYNEQFKTQTLYDFVNTLVDEDGRYLIDGIGLQAHLYTSDSLDQYFKTIDKLAETSLKLQLTELDVCLGKYQAPQAGTDENLRKQGRFYYDLINGLFERVDAGTIKMDALTFWGITDSMSWRKEYKPLLYDTLLKPKYAMYGVFQLKEYAGFD
jgi:endo-1,4-beta-xylanase